LACSSRSSRSAGALLGAALLLLAAADPGIPLVDLEGARVELAPAGEQALVVHFFATWCSDCVGEIDGLARAAQSCGAGPVRVVAVDTGEDHETLARFLAGRALALPVLRDPDGSAWRRAGGRGLPTNLIWTPDGRKTEVGPRGEAAWRERLAALGCPATPEAPAPD
jgi:thiol-disulfide isomerase/thioredoxin